MTSTLSTELESMQRVIVEIDNHVAHVRLNRPDKMNALDNAMFEAIVEVGDQLKKDTSVRAIVLSGEGRAFCAGLDMASFASMVDGGSDGKEDNSAASSGRLEQRTHGIANRVQYVSWVWREMPVPVIAAMHGVAYGGGCQISIGADMRYAAPETRLCIMEMKWGLVPDMGATPFLQKLVGDDIARELTFTNRVVLAEEAKAIGLVTKVCDDPVEEALKIAAEIALKNPEAIRAAKRILNNAPFEDAAAILMAESVEQDGVIGTPNQIEAIKSNLEKRAPNYS